MSPPIDEAIPKIIAVTKAFLKLLVICKAAADGMMSKAETKTIPTTFMEITIVREIKVTSK